MIELKKSDKEQMARRLMDRVIEFRKEINITAVSCEPLYLSEAAELCGIGMTGNMVSNLISLQEQGDKKDQLDFWDKHGGKIIAIIALMLIPLIYYQIMK